MLNDVITKVNEIYFDEGLPLNLRTSDFDAATVKQVAKTEVLRRNTRENQTGVLNNSLYNRNDPTVINRNAATHYFLSSTVLGIFPPLLNNTTNINYVLSVPVEIPYLTLHLMLNKLPTGYYDSSKVDNLKNEYPSGERLNMFLSARETTGNRVMFASKKYIQNIDNQRFFLELKYSQFEDDYFILLKFKASYKYLLLFVPKDFGDAKSLNTLLSRLFNISSHTPVFSTYFQSTGGKNLIVSGAPGTGKSFWIQNNYERTTVSRRVTFHPEYTYNEFIGSLRPISDTDNKITYQFVPGPFTKILQLAYSNPSEKYTLIIEEINRANTAAVFGDVFQILDRDIDGYSDYGIENEDMINFVNEGLTHIQIDEVKLPPNLNLIATMNSADQGVFQMDTAFKRRWNIHYVPIEFEDWHSTTYFKYNKKLISVTNLITILNKYLSENQYLQINEDRLIGPYFLRQEEAEKWLDPTVGYDYYKKLFLYLWDDIARIDRSVLFKKDYYQFSILCEQFEDGQAVFVEELHSKLETKLIDDTSSLADTGNEDLTVAVLQANEVAESESDYGQEEQTLNNSSGGNTLESVEGQTSETQDVE